ncbi:MAG: superoxide dismutase [Phycisphaerae bacterium]|nr:MAG: superoxide dismutase [Phycisphaerae bacterium]
MESTHVQRRDVIGALAVSGLASLALAAQPQEFIPAGKKPDGPCPPPEALGWDAVKGDYVLPALPYAANALEPYIDAKTMEVHHGKHHAAYVAGANKAVTELFRIREGGDAGLVKHWSRELSFHLGGHVNHCLFWRMMAPAGKGGGGQPDGLLAAAITRDFGSYEKFLAHFKAAAVQVEGGGWSWLVYDPHSTRLLIVQQEKQQDMMPTGMRPLLGLDVWEHAYYLKYQNQRSSYVDAWFNVVNWPFVQCLFDTYTRK